MRRVALDNHVAAVSAVFSPLAIKLESEVFAERGGQRVFGQPDVWKIYGRTLNISD